MNKNRSSQFLSHMRLAAFVLAWAVAGCSTVKTHVDNGQIRARTFSFMDILIIVGNNVSTTSLNDYFGYTEDSEALMSQVHKEQTIKSDQRGYFEAGTLVIDFLDPHTSRLLQRRSMKAQVFRNLPLEKRAARLQSIVDEELSNVPIAP